MVKILIKFPTGKFDDNGEQVYQTKTFVKTEIMGRMVRKAFEFKKMNVETFSEEQLDEMIAYVCQLFDNRFTVDEFYDGVPVKEMISECWRCINAVINEFSTATATLPNAQAGELK